MSHSTASLLDACPRSHSEPSSSDRSITLLPGNTLEPAAEPKPTLDWRRKRTPVSQRAETIKRARVMAWTGGEPDRNGHTTHIYNTMICDPSGDRRDRSDRRTRPTLPLDALRLWGRRTWPRRDEERQGAFFVDRFDAMTLAMIVSLLALTIVDGVLTIELLDMNSEEVNPFMAHLLTRGNSAFLLGKYILTATGLPFIVVFKQYPMFGTRFRVGFLIPVFVSLYLALAVYQWRLLDIGRGESPAESAIAAARH
jgi:hypothetical protein